MMRLLFDGTDEEDGKISRNAFPEGVPGLLPATNSRMLRLIALFLAKLGAF
jgi:hypothetical protein